MPSPRSESPPLPSLARAVPGPVGPAAPAPALSSPADAPITSAARPAPTFGGPWARTGRRSSRSARPGERSTASRAGLRGHSRAPSRPALGPSPAATTAPGGGGGMEPPPPPPLPPRSPAEGREGSAPRQDPPLRPPPATSTPSLSPSLPPRALPLNGSESAKEGETGKYPPARVGRSGGRGGAEERGTAAAAGHRPRLGLTVAMRARQGRGAETGSTPAAAPSHSGPAPRRRARPETGTVGSRWERRGSLTRVFPSPYARGVLAEVWGNHPPRAFRGPLQRLTQSSPSSQNRSVVSRGAGACTFPRKSSPTPTLPLGRRTKVPVTSIPSPSEDTQGRSASVVHR